MRFARYSLVHRAEARCFGRIWAVQKHRRGGREVIDTSKYLDEALQLYSRELPASSETAKAIRQDADLAQVSQMA
jgi:hypothetical protein